MIDRITWQRKSYGLKRFENLIDGCGGIEVYNQENPDACLIKITYWDAEVQFFIDIFQLDLPLIIVEWAIFKSKQLVPSTGAAEEVFLSNYPDVKFLKP